MVKYYKNIDELINTKYEDLIEIDGIGGKMANSITTFFKLPQVINMIDRMKKMNVTFENKETDKSSKLRGKSFVITGKLPSGKKRNELADIIFSNGGNVLSSVTKDTDYLISGDEDSKSSKFKKAIEFGISIISENDFFKML